MNFKKTYRVHSFRRLMTRPTCEPFTPYAGGPWGNDIARTTKTGGADTSAGLVHSGMTRAVCQGWRDSGRGLRGLCHPVGCGVLGIGEAST